ncbi:peptidoglycan DD-metalloendopeptidase family protein [Flavobacterium sp. LMO8]|uniref:peptidoglycan DD-metalloendopeptidase family protein n=1 Tax=Flavobacterium sp. LMO8 TaxID=2654244 RepID=UPI0012910F19|nr:peptidoglycan DD-metalloendopeptidase family protein [Flavobacterium sp. LMO8]MQP25382.1 peptidoglycan DD-metalloendopeptidase family protein [Flavobacterium sp. LMO8]
MENLIALFKSIEAAKVIAPEIDYSEYVPLNLSVSNLDLHQQKLETAEDYEIFIQNHLDKNQDKIAFGGYIETRKLYQRSTVFKNTHSDERNIHIGLDLWINKSAPIHAALDGTIHSFQNNTALGDYGPTIILAHEFEGIKFHTLYGHLSENSLNSKKVGDIVKKGEQIATLGLPPINGDYAPHLHFQIIMDMEGKTGDYPGVCSEKTLSFYKSNCPDPNLLLKIV